MEHPEIILKSNDIEELEKVLPEQGPFGEELRANPEKSVIINKNVTSQDPAGKAELHENYTDIFVVLEGSEQLFIGGTITDKESTGPGEWRGAKLEGAREHKVEKGDTIIIPKGIAHKHGIGTLKLLVFKIG